jgi:FeS assembly SUF system protein
MPWHSKQEINKNNIPLCALAPFWKNTIKMEEFKDEVNLGESVVKALKGIYDPEIPVDIYELGLIYDVMINEDNEVKILMTLTSPNCPVAESLPKEVEEKVQKIDTIKSCEVEITFDPPWSKDLMSEEAKLELGML